MDRFIADSIDMREYEAQNDGHEWIHSIIDVYSKFVWSFKMYTKSSEDYVEVSESLFLTEEYPEILHCDNGSEFKKSIVDLCDSLNICRIYGRVKYP
ncbi:hypothetical protein ENBRE01_1825 [Enteropsectra breve]|nr:hypothetical protein ENBRE01_1825 [Enteropsectra breve]